MAERPSWRRPGAARRAGIPETKDVSSEESGARTLKGEQCGATCVPAARSSISDEFDLVLRDVRLADAKPNQPASDIGGKTAATPRSRRRGGAGRSHGRIGTGESPGAGSGRALARATRARSGRPSA